MQYFTDTDMGLDLGQVNLSVESAFADHGRGLVQMPPKVYITLPEGDFRTMPAYLPSLSIAGVKIVNVHPNNPKSGLPTVMALTIILDLATGQPVAIINATRLTDMRTGAAGAVAAKHLSPKKGDRAGGDRDGQAGRGTGGGHLPRAEDQGDPDLGA